ncbi:MAG: EEP domain-containing protein, partial [Boseongicola sp. SB0670_bin_30]|nr:EEP domain-containing protein [Boseongicola sp. SB0670_bin_30]
MKLVTYNVRYARGLDGKFDYDRIAHAVEGGDVIALQEVERHWRRSGMADQVALIEERLPRHHSCYGPAFDVDASETAPDGHVTNRRRQFGTMILSRWPVREARTHILPKIATKRDFNMDT